MCLENPSAAGNLQNSYAADVSAEQQNAPAVYGLNAQYSPLYTQLATNNLNTFLNGTNGGNGYLSLYQNQIAPAAAGATAASNSTIRQGNLNDAATMLPQMTSLTRSANPAAAGLLDNLTTTASQQLGYGTQLTPAEQNQLDQSVRGGQAARGLGFGPSDVLGESIANTNLGQNLLQQREQQASGAAAQSQGFYGHDLATIMGTGANMGTAGQLSATGMGGMAPSSSSEFAPNASLIGAQMGENYNASQTGAANNNQGIAMGIGAGEGLLSAGLGGM